MLELLKKAVITFFLVIAGITISSAIFITIFYPHIDLNIILIWQIIVMAFVSTLGNFIYYSRNELSKRQMIQRICFHYIYVNLVVLGGAFWWQWISPGYLVEFIVMLLMIAVVYVGVMLVNFKREAKTAEALNQKLSKLNSEETEK